MPPPRTFVADGLNRAQRNGRACASCGKRWPRPAEPIGRLVTGQPLFVCDECVVAVEALITNDAQPVSLRSPLR
ncbi:hypothetical protein [Actinocorallia longicatena]|uniref:hypothetical protein n=1 Tax=Actinocorallia longicatena TaxID=111803 RepID=UPI0031DEE4A0